VGVGGPFGDDQPGGDLPVGQALGDQSGDLVFAPGQRQPGLAGGCLARVGGRPEGGGDLVAAAQDPARVLDGCADNR
jgi:hypothetical protein